MLPLEYGNWCYNKMHYGTLKALDSIFTSLNKLTLTHSSLIRGIVIFFSVGHFFYPHNTSIHLVTNTSN